MHATRPDPFCFLTPFASGLAGGTISRLQGGRFGHGFVSAAGSAATTPFTDAASAKGVVMGAVATSVVGGTLSKLSGGKFANGAVTAAMSYAFNYLGHVEPEPARPEPENLIQAVLNAPDAYMDIPQQGLQYALQRMDPLHAMQYTCMVNAGWEFLGGFMPVYGAVRGWYTRDGLQITQNVSVVGAGALAVAANRLQASESPRRNWRTLTKSQRQAQRFRSIDRQTLRAGSSLLGSADRVLGVVGVGVGLRS